MFVSYSVATGKQAGIAYRYSGACSSAAFTVLWADDSARHVIGESQVAPVGDGISITGQPAWPPPGPSPSSPVPPLGQWSTQPAW